MKVVKHGISTIAKYHRSSEATHASLSRNTHLKRGRHVSDFRVVVSDIGINPFYLPSWSNTQQDHMSDPKTALAAFKTWFSSVGGFINPACELIYTAHAGVTLRVKKDYVGVFPAGEVAISCPHGVSLSALNAADLAPWAGLHTTHDTSRRLEAQENSNVKPLLALPTNIIRNARPQFVAAVWIAVQYLLGDESPWKPYFSILPGLPHDDENNAGDIGTKRGLGELDTPLWWSRGERLWLQGTNLAKGIADLEEVWDEEWKKWEGVIGEWGRSRGLVIEW